MKFLKYSGVLLIVAFFAASFPSRAEILTVVGDQPPDESYQPIIQRGRPVLPALILSPHASPSVMQGQILRSAAQIHQVHMPDDISSVLPVTFGGTPSASGSTPSSSRLTGKPVANATSSTPSPAAPAVPDFSYLFLLVATLPFVVAMRQLVALGNSEGGTHSPQGLSLLQNVFTGAWSLMLQDGSQGKLAQVKVTLPDFSIPVYDTYAPGTPGHLTPNDIANMNNVLAITPPALRQNISEIVNGPVTAMWNHQYGSATTGSEISLDGGTEIYDVNFAHEIGVSYYASAQFKQGPVFQQWTNLWNQSTDPAWDTADVFSNFPVQSPSVPPPPNPFGSISEVEDFATIFNDWMNDSATPAIYLNSSMPRSASILEQAVYVASLPASSSPKTDQTLPQNPTLLLQKVLLMAALFTDPSTQQLSLYNWQNYKRGNTIERTQVQVVSSPISLKLGNYLFTVQNGKLTGYTALDTQVTVSFPLPVPIPPYAAQIWGID